MRSLPTILALSLVTVLLAACGDLTSAPQDVSVGSAGPGRTLVLEPVIVVAECDPYTSISWCEDDGDGDCMTSNVGPETDLMGLSGCGETGGTKPVPPPGEDPQKTPYQVGPLAWAACVLAVLGSAYSVDQVAGTFTEWWGAQQDLESARRMLDAIRANPAAVSQETVALWEFRVEYHRNRRDAAMNSLVGATNTSYWALAGAAAACGAAAFLPTP